MFKTKHHITLVNDSTFSLYGKDYFGDKRVFWNAHQSTLNSLVEEVREVGGPIVVTYPSSPERSDTYETVDTFLKWLKLHHPVNL